MHPKHLQLCFKMHLFNNINYTISYFTNLDVPAMVFTM